MAVATAVFALLTLISVAAPTVAGSPAAGGKVELHLFWLRTCSHCAAARGFLAELKDEVPELVVYEHEVSSDSEAQRLFVEMVDQRGGTAGAVPTIIIGDKMWIGFDDTIATSVRNEVMSLAGRGASSQSTETIGSTESAYVDVPLIGEVDVGSSSLLVSTIVIAFVDGVNPCSLWVLSILLALVLHSGSRRRVALVGSTFLIITAALYGLYMLGAYSLLNYASYLPWIQRTVAAVVAVFAVVNLRDYFRAGRRSPLSIPESAKPRIYRRARSLIGSERSVLAVITGTVVLAAGVSLVETPCSAALPLMWTDLVATRDATTAAAVTLFLIYMAIFLADELILFGAAVVTMRATRLQEQHGRALRLVTGSVMLCLAVAMLVDPDLLNHVAGTLGVLVAAIAVTAVLAAIGRRLPRQHRVV